MPNQRIGDYTFVWNPDEMTIPERRKTVSSVKTYTGSALFQWGAFIAGTEVELTWEWVSEAQYRQLRKKYLSLNTFEWNPELGGTTYSIVIKYLEGKFFTTGLYEQPYRKDVRMILEIRETMSTTSTTSTTTTTVTTTTLTTTSTTVVTTTTT